MEPFYQNMEGDIEKRQQIVENRWVRGTTFDIGYWEDVNAPVINIRRKEDVAQDATEACDVLTDEKVGACSSFLSKAPEIGLFVQNKCALMKMVRNVSSSSED